MDPYGSELSAAWIYDGSNGRFYIDWYQRFHGEIYAKAMRDLMREDGMTGAVLRRAE